MKRPRCLRCKRCMRAPSRRRRPGEVYSSGRGLCVNCYGYASLNRKLHLYPLKIRRAADVAEDVEFLQSDGWTLDQIAERLGYKNRHSLTRALLRHRRRMEETQAA